MQTMAFRPSLGKWGCVALCVFPFFVVGMVNVLFDGNSGYLCFALLGGLALGGILIKAQTRVVVDSTGLAKRTWAGGAFRASWTEIESWRVNELSPTDDRADSVTNRAVCFRLKGTRREVLVTNYDASRPSFETFVSLVREHIADREIAERAVGAEPRLEGGD